MSRTIVTKSDSEFFTNVNSEQLLGELCYEVGAKHYTETQFPNFHRLAYSMTKDEADEAALRLKILFGQEDEYFVKYRGFFDEDCTPEDLTEFLVDYIKCFEDSHGYECI